MESKQKSKGFKYIFSGHVRVDVKDFTSTSHIKPFSFSSVLFKHIYMIMAIFLKVGKKGGRFWMKNGLGAMTDKGGIAFSILLHSKEDIN